MLPESVYRRVEREFGLSCYVFDEDRFRENFALLTEGISEGYRPYRIAYSFKTNYTPRIGALVRELGGLAEVVSGMEYDLARRLGFPPEDILFNGPSKGAEGIRALLQGALILIDNTEEAENVLRAAREHPDKTLRVGFRVHADIGSGKPSRFGLPGDPAILCPLRDRLRECENLRLEGIQCHISGSRSLEGWRRRGEVMLSLAQELFPAEPPRFIDLGSGMFGRLPAEMRSSFGGEIPSFGDYGRALGPIFQSAWGHLPPEQRPTLITEPGTTLVADTMSFAARVSSIKELDGKTLAVLDASIHNLGVLSEKRNLPLLVLDAVTPRQDVDLTGYTCLEYDKLYRGYTGALDVGSMVVFDNIGSYSNGLKPPFIRPDVPMAAYDRRDDSLRLIRRRETAEDIFATYIF